MNNQELMGNLLSVVMREPDLDTVLCLMELSVDETPQSRFVMNILTGISQALKHSSIPASMIPIASNDVRAMLAELQGVKFLQGARGSKPADLEALVEVIYHIVGLAQALKADLESLEINPLRVDGSQIEALDAVIAWQRSQT